MRRYMLFILSLSLCGSLFAGSAAQTVALGARRDSLKFAVIGDNGTGAREQYELGRRMGEARETFPFELVLMMGDNLYGGQGPKDFAVKFERP